VDTQTKGRASADGTVTVGSLKEARNVGVAVTKVIVHEDGKPDITLFRRVIDGDVQGLVGVDCRIGINIRVPKNAIIACGSVVEGDIVVCEKALIVHSQIRGACEIDPGAVLNDACVSGADKSMRVYRDMMAFCREE